jgi:Ca-activated chloride channel family protein
MKRVVALVLMAALTAGISGCSVDHSAEMQPPPPPAPPPPPPPPPPVVAMMSPQVTVTGSRISRYGLVSSTAFPAAEDRERYQALDPNSVKRVAQEPVSTFSIDVDTGSYSNVRRFLTGGRLPPADAVRVEEMLNYFRYDYPLPADRSRPFSVTTNVTLTPWNPNTRLLRIGIRGYDIARAQRPAANLVFLVDTSGSMQEPDKLPLVKTALSLLADRMGPQDSVSIVAYAGSAGLVLAPTHDPRAVKAALAGLEAGGSTAGGAGIALAYATARASRIPDGINRILLATDGDFNVGVSDDRQLKDLVRRNRDDGITLTTLGFGEGNYNEAMMEQIADVGNGNYSYIDSAMEAQKVLDTELSSTLFTIAKDVKVQIEFNPALVSEYRLIGYENRVLKEEDFNNDKVDAGDIGAGHMVTALYEIVPAGAKGWLPGRHYPANRPVPKTAAPARELAFLQLRYKLPNEDQSRLIQQPIAASAARAARAPSGDMAFAAAVAAFGQKLKGDERLGRFGWGDIKSLAGAPEGYWRQEFVKLVDLAAAQQPAGAGGGERRR